MKIYHLVILLAALQGSLLAQSPLEKLDQWSAKAPIEKIYLHFDREHYLAGETAWFKAYLSSDYQPVTTSSTLYVELLSNGSSVISRLAFPIMYGCSNGQVVLPDSLFTGDYLVRAYTAGMLNLPPGHTDLSSVMVYEHPLRITGIKNMAAAKAKEKMLRVEFFPEGGNFVAGLNNSVAFKLTNEYGMPADGRGVVETEAGEKVAEFASYHDGMGVFDMEPQPGVMYYARLEGDASGKRHVLPAASQGGVVFRIVPHVKGGYFEVFYKEGGVNRKPAYLLGQIQHHVVFRKELASGKSDWSGVIDKNASSSGVIQVTVFDGNDMPLAERLLFADNKEYRLPAVLRADTVNTKARSRNQLSLSFKDTITGNFSVSVTDADYTAGEGVSQNIISALLLTGDLRGYIHQPGWYFSASKDSAETGLDLLMMVNGWRRFSWGLLKPVSATAPRYKDDGFISVSGRIVEKGTEKILKDYDLSVLVSSEDSLQNSFEMIHTDENGRFRMDSQVFSGRTRFYVSDIKGRKSKWISIYPDADSLVVPSPGIAPASCYFTKKWVSENNLYVPDYDAIAREKGDMLQDIKLVVKKKTPLQELDEKYASGMFSGINQKVIDLVNTKEKIYHRNIFDYIEGRVTGIDVVRNGIDYEVYYRQNFSLRAGRIPMTLYLDEMQADANIISTIPADQIAMVKVYPNFVAAPGNGPGGVLAVYTKKGADVITTSETSAGMFIYKGYTVMREFYAPDYSADPSGSERPDQRITLAWQPLMLVESAEASIPLVFYNNDRTKRFRVVVEGMTWNGKLVHEERIITAGDK